MNKVLKSLALALSLCLTLGFSAYAVTSTEFDQDSPVIDLACSTVANYRTDYYDVTDMSGEITNIEYGPDSVDIIIKVEYLTTIRADTPDDSPYVQGIKDAISEIEDPEGIEKATTYLNMWCSELEREHIGKKIPHHSELKVSIPTNNSSELNLLIDKSLDLLDLDNAQIMYRQYKFIVDGEATNSRDNNYEDANTYVDKPIDSFALPTDEEVRQNAYNDVQRIISNNTAVNRSTRAEELDRVDAATYAKDPDNFPYNANYSYFGNDGGDCANFVSQCYYEGGLTDDDSWYMYSTEWINTGGSRSEHYGLSDYMQDNDIVFWVDGGTDIKRAFAGSIIYYQSGTDGGHVGIVTSNDGRYMKYSAHTTDHCDEDLDQDWFSEHCDFLIPCWDSWSGTWTPQ